MDYLKKFYEYLKERKYITISFLVSVLVCIISGYVLHKAINMPPLPEKVDIEDQRNWYADFCNMYSCILNWVITSDLKEMDEKEGCEKTEMLNGTLQLYHDGKIDRAFIEGYYSFVHYHNCHRHCSIDGPFRYYPSFLDFQMQYAWAHANSVMCGKREADLCQWVAYNMLFSVYFAYFYIPATVVFNYINLTTMRKLFLSNPGAAQHLHLAEIVTDGLLNLIVGIHDNILFFQSWDWWRKTCGYYRFTSVFSMMHVVKLFIAFLNQIYLTGLVLERFFGLAKPFQYNGISKASMKKRGRKLVFGILLGSCAIYFPFFLFNTFSPTFEYWKVHSAFWKANYVYIEMIVLGFYNTIGFVPFVMQIVVGVLVEKKYRKFISKRKRNINTRQKEIKNQARDKQLLLAGTIGLNLVTGAISAIRYCLGHEYFYVLVGFSENYKPWWPYLVNMVNTVFIFLNGNSAVLIHVLLIESYRAAFKKTFLGKLVFRENAVNTIGLTL